MIRKIFSSRETNVMAKKAKNKKVQIMSFFPIDRFDCECAKDILEWKKKLATSPEKDRASLMSKQGYLTCSHNKEGMRRRVITCKNCKEVLGYCWATDDTLKDWCDFHYIQWSDGEEWHGCFTPHISPITQQLCLECCCGADTRDFSANMTLPGKVAYRIEEKNKIGRKFGEKDSKFQTRIVSANVLPFK